MEINFNFEPQITKEYLLSKYSEETYMTYYLGIPVKKGLFKSPLRKDKCPTCSFYRNKSGELIFKDFNGSFYGNFISVVMYKYGLTYYKALNQIAIDFGFISGKPAKVKKIPTVEKFVDSGESDIRVEIKEYSKKELDWWNSFGITPKILNKFKVFSCKNIFSNILIHLSFLHNSRTSYYF